MRKGIILAGGQGTRLHPITNFVSKKLLPVFDKPMINYSLSILMLSNIRDVLIISTPRDINNFKDYLGDGKQYGLKLSYAVQKKPNGIAEAFIIGESFIKKSSVALILGDNIFFGSELSKILKKTAASKKNTIFLCHVNDPNRFGVAYIRKKKLIKIIEKPKKKISNLAVTGLYYFDNSVINISKKLKPSKRGELEITDINNFYLKKKKLNYQILSRSTSWKDAGTFQSILEIGNIIQYYQKTTSKYIGLLEEIAFNQNWISKKKFKKNIDQTKNKEIKNYLSSLC